MILLQKDFVESFCLEIISNAEKIIKDINKISSHDFASNSSIHLIEVMKDFSKSIQISTKIIFDEIDWEDKDQLGSKYRILKRLKESIQFISSNLQFIENSSIGKIPWRLVEPFQEISSEIIPNSRILLCQQWNYNYSVLTFNLFDKYKKHMHIIEQYIDAKDLKSLEEKLSEPLYLISFPYLEKNNILLYSLLGHEVGHLVADSYFDDGFLFSDELKEKLIENYKSKDKELSITVNQKEYLKFTNQVWERLFKELLSDVVGSLIFGPAMLFSMFEFSMSYDMDTAPNRSNRFYPPWRGRLRLIYNSIIKFMPSLSRDEGENLFFDGNVLKRFKELKEIIDDETDIDLMKKEILIFNIYEDVLKKIESLSDELLEKFNRKEFDEFSFFGKVDSLTKRLKKGVPPNIVDELDLNTSSTLTEIINAAWKYRLSWEENIFDENGFNERYMLERKKLNQLTIKAIEYIDLIKKYKTYKEVT